MKSLMSGAGAEVSGAGVEEMYAPGLRYYNQFLLSV